MPGTPAHYQDFVAIGTVKEVIVKGGQVTWIALEIDVHEPCLVALAPGRCPVPPDLARGDLLHVRGEWYTERSQGSRHGMPFLRATRCLERLRRPAIAATATANAGPGPADRRT
jgi:hypothetical protein